MSTRLPALFRTLLAGLLALASCAFAATADTADFTLAELASVQKVVDQVEAFCVSQMPAAKADAAPDASAPGDPFEIDDWPDYCPCIAAEARRRITPELMRHGSPAQRDALVRASAMTCAVHHLQERFGPFCHAVTVADSPDSPWQMLRSRSDAPALPLRPDPASVDRFCQCAQVDIDQLDADNFEAFTKQTVADSAEYHRTGKLPEATGPSLLATVRRCGPGTLSGAKAR